MSFSSLKDGWIRNIARIRLRSDSVNGKHNYSGAHNDELMMIYGTSRWQVEKRFGGGVDVKSGEQVKGQELS